MRCPSRVCYALARIGTGQTPRVNAGMARLVAVTRMRATIRRLVFRLNLLTMLLNLMSSVRLGKSAATVDATKRRHIFFALQMRSYKLAKRIGVGRVDRPPEAGSFSVDSQTEQMAANELRIYHTLRELGVRVDLVDLLHTPLTSPALVTVVMNTPEPKLEASTDEDNVDRLMMTSPRLPIYRKKAPARLNKRILFILRERRDPGIALKLTNLLFYCTIMPNLTSLELILRYLGRCPGMELSSLLAIDAIIQAGYSFRPYIMRVILRSAVKFKMPQLAEYMVESVVKESKKLKDGKGVEYWLKDVKLINSIMSTSIKLERPDIYSVFRREFIRQRLYPSLDMIVAEIRFAYLTGNADLAKDSWAVLTTFESKGVLKTNLTVCLWMAKLAERTGDVEVMKQIVDVAQKRKFMNQLKTSIRRD